jgi:predicted kinase
MAATGLVCGFDQGVLLGAAGRCRQLQAAAMEPLRCHVMVGPPASGKTTTALALAPLLRGPEGQPAVVLSTDAIRAEIFGDASVQGPWSAIEERLHERLLGAVAAGMPVIVDATHAERAWRLAITQQLALPRPVEWIGWWLFTPLGTCLRWNAKRERQVPAPVIRRMAASLADGAFGPGRLEGFAAVVAVQPTQQRQLVPFLRGELAQLRRRISAACNRQSQLQLHGHSRLLDLERLLYLIKLLADHPDLATTDQGSREALEMVVSPLPGGGLAERAAALLRKRHGVCYGDPAAVRRDLDWLASEGFLSAMPVTTAIRPLDLEDGGAGSAPAAGGVHGGYPAMADQAVFVRVMTLLRHLLQTPFDHPAGSAGPSQSKGSGSMQEHLLEQLAAIPGGHGPRELASLRKDIEKLLTPYGFRLPHDNPRHGYCLGTALLSAPRLVDIHGVVQHAAQRLGDPTAQDLLSELEQRLAWGGIETAGALPLRAYLDGAQPGLEPLQRGSLAEAGQAQLIETAILEHRRLRLLRLPGGLGRDRPSGLGRAPGRDPGEHIRGWPLQLVYSGGQWHLAWEEDAIGRPQGLLQVERLERLAFDQAEPRSRRNATDHQGALGRLELLLHHCVGTELGTNSSAQAALCQGNGEQRRRQLQTLRFSCKGTVFDLIREGQLPLPLDQIRLAKPPPNNELACTSAGAPTAWIHPAIAQTLKPNPPTDSHPHPVEIDLPSWILSGGIALRRWLFSFGSAIRIEAPEALRVEQQGMALEVLAQGQWKGGG